MVGGIFSDAAGMGIDAIARRDPKVKGSIPTVEDLEAEFHRIYDKAPPIPQEEVTPVSDKKSEGTACIPCTLSHVSACAGELNEAVRFARSSKDLSSDDVVKRINHCMSEIAAAERIDLAPENTEKLPQAEKELAIEAANQLRTVRHDLEWLKSVDDLEKLAAQMANLQHSISKAWFTQRLKTMTPEEREKVKAKAQELIEKKLAGDDL